MKALFAYMDLILLVVFMLFGLPLIINIATVSRNSSMSYMDDKTLYTIGDNMEWIEVGEGEEKRWVPSDASALKTDFGGALCSALVQDDYCPADGRKVEYLLNADSTRYAETASSNGTLQIVTGWRTLRLAEFDGVLAEIGTNANFNTYRDKNLYIVWNVDRDCWMVTGKFVNIY